MAYECAEHAQRFIPVDVHAALDLLANAAYGNLADGNLCGAVNVSDSRGHPLGSDSRDDPIGIAAHSADAEFFSEVRQLGSGDLEVKTREKVDLASRSGRMDDGLEGKMRLILTSNYLPS